MTSRPQWEIDFPHSLGLLYSAFTYFTGFKVNSGEYKLMGLAPYGEPRYADLILDNIFDLKADGTFHMDMQYFNYATGLTMTNERFDALFGGPPRSPNHPSRSVKWTSPRPSRWSPRSAYCGWDGPCIASWAPRTCASPGGSR